MVNKLLAILLTCFLLSGVSFGQGYVEYLDDDATSDDIYTVASSAATTFTLDADDGTDINSSGYGAAGTGGYVYLATRIEQTHAHSEYSAQDDARTASASNWVSLTAGNTLEVYLKGITDTTSGTITTGQFNIDRIH